MKWFDVTTEETHIVVYRVEATSEEDAKEMLLSGQVLDSGITIEAHIEDIVMAKEED